MATPQLIDLSNYSTLLVQSTQSRAGSPDGNFFFDVANGRVEIITAEELAQVDLGSGLEANPLTQDLGIKMEACYAFERQERRVDEELRKYDPFFDGVFKFGGAYNAINGRKFDDASGSGTSLTGDDRAKLRGSGWRELAADGSIDRIYYGAFSLSPILALSQPYYQLSNGGAPVDFNKDGPIDEAIQVFGTTANGDAGAGNFDTRTFLSLKVRTYGQNYDEKQLADSGVTEMGGYATGFAIGETPHLTSGAFALADVYGGAQISPWTGMTLEQLAAPQVESGFNEADGNFTWVLNNDNNGSLYEAVAFLDALAQTDDDIDSGAISVTNGKRVGTWYAYDAQGRIVTNSPFSSQGLFIENVPTADEQLVVFTDDAGGTKTRPFQVSIQVTVGPNAVADTNAWYHAFYLDGPGGSDFNTVNALTIQDSTATEVKGNVATDQVSNRIDFAFDYDGDTIGGPAGTDKDGVFQCEGDGGVTAAKTVFTISRTTTIAVSCVPGVETNV
ncbi:MAG: hypothetical protein AAF358_13685 [Pseudomonadota bacterium]